MVDIHSHFLWGIDDGAIDIKQSRAMLEAARAAGTTDIVATPHCNSQYLYDVDAVDRRIAELAAADGAFPRIHRGCELHLSFDTLDRLLGEPSTFTICGSRYLLVECPDSRIGNYAEPVLQRLLDANLVPVIAHPERNPALHGKLDRLEAWVGLGCLVQVTAHSFMGVFGSAAKRASVRIIDRGLAHVIAGDAHDPAFRHARLDQAYEAVRAAYGDGAAETLLVSNPRAILKGLPLGGKQIFKAETPRKWWRRQ